MIKNTTIKLSFIKAILGLLVSSIISCVHAAPVTLDEIANKAVQSNPDVVSKWHEFKASIYERDTAWGNNLPTLDVMFGNAYQRQKNPFYTPPESLHNYNNRNSSIILNQNLFEGFATLNNTKRLEHASLVRFYEMLDLSENTALDAATAYIDVWRHRQLVEYAKKNYVTHRLVYTKISDRAKSGVGRQVDMETAAGRMALAESNLVTETANLHDVNARYQRIIGELPKDDMDPPSAVFSKDLPTERSQSIAKGFEKSPKLKAAFENILSVKRNVEVQKAGFFPRVDAFLEKQHDNNDSGYFGVKNITTIGLTAKWNLFGGYQDSSRKLKAVEEVYMAKDLREKTCREVRQSLATSFNDHQRLTEQLVYLDQHQLSTDKVREAFRNQYEIGQRTLLDVLDIENEFYKSRQDSINAEMDLMIADAKYQAASGNLLNALKLKNLDMTPPKPETTPDEDMSTNCPAEPVSVPEYIKEVKPPVIDCNRVILLPNSDGSPSAVVLKTANGTEVIDKPYEGACVNHDGAISQLAETSATVSANYAAALEAQPKRPKSYIANFIYGTDKISPDSLSEVEKMKADLKTRKIPEITVIGHTDMAGSDKYNDTLSLKRAMVMRNILINQGINPSQIEVAGRGKREPLIPTADGVKEPKNRRVEINIR